MEKTFKERQEEIWEKESQLNYETLSLATEMLKELTPEELKLFEGIVINEYDVILKITDTYVKIGDGAGGYVRTLGQLSRNDLKEIINHIFYLEILK
jgi:hypothetical protein